MTVTIDKYERISRAYAEARTLAVDLQAIKETIKNSAWIDAQGKLELEAAIDGIRIRKKQAVLDVINDQTPVTP